MPMSFRDRVAVYAFATFFFLATLPAYFVALAGPWATSFLSPEKQALCSPWVSRIVIVLTSLGWRFALSVCFWLRIKLDGLEAMRLSMGASGRPCVVLTNHTSVLDSILIVCFLPLARVGKVKMVLARDILEMPCVGQIAKAMGQLAVPLQSSPEEQPQSSEEQEGIHEPHRLLEEYLGLGGYALWFPEDRPNTDEPLQVEEFHASRLTLAVHVDVEVWCFALVGNLACWPKELAVGGLPSRIGVSAFRLCESSHQFFEELEDLAANADEGVKAVRLADAARGEIQSKVDGLARALACGGANGGRGGAGAPVAGAFGGAKKER